MNILAIDLGTYSVKFLLGTLEGKKIQFFDLYEELLIDHMPKGLDEEEQVSIEQVQLEIAHDFINSRDDIDKVIINLPNQLITTRFFKVPIKNQKKVELTIPFQIEQNPPPFSINESHYANMYIPLQNGTYSITSITKKNVFDQFYKIIQSFSVVPQAIVSEESAFQSLIENETLDDHFAILNLGHSESRCYMFNKKIMVDVNISFLAGKVIDEVIAETYDVPIEEAIIFKHETSFFLTDEQINSVTEKQKTFALLMKRIFQALINDFKRWNISYQMNHGSNIKRIYITGGLSGIKNIEGFLSQELGVHVEKLNLYENHGLDNSGLDSATFQSLTTARAIATHFSRKKGIADFRTGDYSAPAQSGLPLHSLSFISARMVLVCFIVGLALIYENVSTSNQITMIERQITPLLKTPELEITNRERRAFRDNPKVVYNKMIKKSKVIEEEKNFVKETQKINAISSLAQLSKLIGPNLKVELMNYTNKENSVTAEFRSEEIDTLKRLSTSLESQNLSDLKLDLSSARKTLTAQFSAEDL